MGRGEGEFEPGSCSGIELLCWMKLGRDEPRSFLGIDRRRQLWQLHALLRHRAGSPLENSRPLFEDMVSRHSEMGYLHRGRPAEARSTVTREKDHNSALSTFPTPPLSTIRGTCHSDEGLGKSANAALPVNGYLLIISETVQHWYHRPEEWPISN